MSDRTKTKIAFAEAITQTLWVRGLITAQERDRIARNAGEKLRRGKC